MLVADTMQQAETKRCQTGTYSDHICADQRYRDGVCRTDLFQICTGD